MGEGHVVENHDTALSPDPDHCELCREATPGHVPQQRSSDPIDRLLDGYHGAAIRRRPQPPPEQRDPTGPVGPSGPPLRPPPPVVRRQRDEAAQREGRVLIWMVLLILVLLVVLGVSLLR